MKKYIKPELNCEVLNIRLMQAMQGTGGGQGGNPTGGGDSNAAPYRYLY